LIVKKHAQGILLQEIDAIVEWITPKEAYGTRNTIDNAPFRQQTDDTDHPGRCFEMIHSPRFLSDYGVTQQVILLPPISSASFLFT
jgi:hypothetical protein